MCAEYARRCGNRFAGVVRTVMPPALSARGDATRACSYGHLTDTRAPRAGCAVQEQRQSGGRWGSSSPSVTPVSTFSSELMRNTSPPNSSCSNSNRMSVWPLMMVNNPSSS